MTDNNSKTINQEETELSFEQALRQLEQVVRQLETGELSLDQSLNAFREGTELARLCRMKLDEVEQSIAKLVATDDGELVEEAFPEQDND